MLTRSTLCVIVGLCAASDGGSSCVQLVARIVPQPQKAAAEVAPRDAPESAAKPQPINVRPVEVAAARPTVARVPVRETGKSRPAADPADDDEELILQQKRVIRKRTSPEGPVRRVALASSEVRDPRCTDVFNLEVAWSCMFEVV